MMLRARGITDHRLIHAVSSGPRARFLDNHFPLDGLAMVGEGQVSLKVLDMVHLLEMGAIKEGEHIAIIGAGTGWSAAMVAALGAQVTGYERHQRLVDRARDLLMETDIVCFWNDGVQSVLLNPAAYHKVVFTCAAASSLVGAISRSVSSELIVPLLDRGGALSRWQAGTCLAEGPQMTTTPLRTSRIAR